MRPASAVALAAVLAYLPSFAGAFQFDDYNVIVDYPTVHSWQALFERAGGGVRAVLKASYTLNWTLGLGLFGLHLVNIALHAVNAALVLRIGKRLFPQHLSAVLAAALLFALHPVQTEAVTYVSGRSASLMAAFYLGAMVWYLRGGHWLGSAALFLLALGTRETAVTLPAALLLCEFVRGTPLRVALRRQAALWLILVAGALVLLLNQRYFDLVAFGYGRRSLADNLVTQVAGVSYLVLRLVYPLEQNIDPALPSFASLEGILVPQAALLLALLAFGLLSLRKRPWMAFGILWFFLQLAPTNSIVPRLDVANDRQLYLASWGLLMALCIQWQRIEFPRRASHALAAALLALLAACNVLRQLDYVDEITLWEADARKAPWNARAHNNLGHAYQLAGREAEARREYEAALLFDPAHEKARANLRVLDWR